MSGVLRAIVHTSTRPSPVAKATISSGNSKRMPNTATMMPTVRNSFCQRLRSERNATAKLVTIWVAVVYLILTLGVGGALAYFGRREILDLSRTYDDALRKQHEHNEQLQEQAWLRAGQTALAEQGVG